MTDYKSLGHGPHIEKNLKFARAPFRRNCDRYRAGYKSLSSDEDQVVSFGQFG